MAYTFKGGVHLQEYKLTEKDALKRMPTPSKVSIPLSQHIGAHCTPLVKVGDEVKKGQKIADVESGLGCPVHASISGKVLSIDYKYNAMGVKVAHVVIESDGNDTLSDDIKPFEGSLDDIKFEDVVNITREAGISGMGGATFPTYAKLNSAKDKVDTLIINCAECEPFITANHRLLLENPDAVIGGLKLLLKVFGLPSGIIAIENNKKDAIKLISDKTADDKMIEVKILETKYPQGDERQLIYALTGREIPAGGLPADVKCLVINTETISAIYNAFITGMPLIERIVTLSGDCIKEPGNIVCPLGTSYKDVVDFCGGYIKEPFKVINGGPMMGMSQWDIEAPVTKGTSALLFLSEDYHFTYNQAPACIRCGRCVQVCQMHLMPSYLALFARKGDYDMCEKYNVLSCVECGACSYICPGFVPITALNRAAKFKVIEKRKSMAKPQNKEEKK